MEMDTPLTGTEASCTKGMETEPCVDTELEQHARSDTVVAADRAEVETCASVEVVDVVLDDADLAGYGDRLMKDVLDNSGQEICLESHVAGVVDVSELKPCSDIQDKEVEERVGTRVKDGWSSTELPVIHECEVLDMENPVKGARIHEDVKPKQVMNDSEMEDCVENHSFEILGNGDLKLFSCSNEVKEVGSDVGFEPCARQEVKQQPSNDDVLSEVCNPVLTPKHVCSSLDVVSGDHGVCGETTSACSRNSCTDGSLCEEERSGCKSEPVSASCVVLEIPKHVRPTGIRKITFKFSKRQQDSSDAKPLVGDEFHEDFCDNKLLVSAAEPLASNVSNNNERFNLANAEMNVSIGLNEFHDTQSTFSCVPNRELKMSKKIIPDNYPTSVQKLLSTRILEGAKVKYISMSGKSQIFGIIKGCGYVCGCSACNFSKVVSAYEFEVHAGCKTRHPNNQIYLENGKPICSIIEELRTAPLTALDDVIRSVAGSSVNEEYFQVFKANLHCSNDVSYADSACPSKHLSMYNSSTSYQSHPAEDNPCPASYHYFHLNPGSYIEAPVDQKRLIKKPRHYFSGSVGEHKKVGKGGTKKRDNDLHKLLFMPNGLPDGTDLAYYSKGKRILGGYKQGNGIVCSCCDTEISPSQFEAHAGWSAKRQPYRHIYTSNGLTLHDIALMLASGRNLATSGSDDMCAICGDGGETIICNGCPRAFHASCLGLQCLPANDWHCPHCIEKFGSGRKASGDLGPIIVRLKRVVKAPEHEPGGCVVCRSQEFSAAKFDDLTVILCDQCEKEYHVGCLRKTGLCDLKELPEDKWFCCDDCIKIYEALQKLASSGPEVIPASVSATLYKKHAETGLDDKPENEIQWRLLSGKSRFSEHLMILSRAAAIFRERFDPIVAQSGRDLIPVMVYGRNISGQEFSGMYCVVLIVKSVVVSAALLRIFGRDAAEIPLVATSRDNQGKGYFQALFSCIERLLSSMSVKHMVLPAAEEAESMWTKKLGFRKTSNEKVPEYARDLQLTIFKGTSLLEKEVQLWHD